MDEHFKGKEKHNFNCTGTMGTNWGSLEYTGTCGHANFKVTKNIYRSKMNSNYISWTYLEQF